MDEPRTSLDDPRYAAFAWGRFKRILWWMAGVAALASAVAVAMMWWSLGELRIHVAIATVLGTFFTIMMTAPAITVTPDESILGALALMTRRRIRHLPVMDGGRCVGVVSIGDLVKHRIERIESEAEAMRAYIQQV